MIICFDFVVRLFACRYTYMMYTSLRAKVDNMHAANEMQSFVTSSQLLIMPLIERLGEDITSSL